tara:strand:- start:2157 stop:2663 length:507 start_codon:yes stop_codon:yes gene_type:complete
MAKVRITNLKQLNSSLRKKILLAVQDKKVTKSVGETIVTDIQKNKTSASAATQKTRKYLEKGNKTDKAYSRSKINVTFTGELLKDLIKNIRGNFTGAKAVYTIEHTENGKHKKYKTPKGKLIGKTTKTYDEIQGYLKDMGYDYLVFSEKAKKEVIKLIRNKILKKLGK